MSHPFCARCEDYAEILVKFEGYQICLACWDQMQLPRHLRNAP